MDGQGGEDRVVIRFARRWIALYLAVGTIILVVLRVGLDSGEPLVDYPLGGLSFWIGLRMLLHPLAVVDPEGFAVWGLIVGRGRRVHATRLRTDGRHATAPITCAAATLSRAHVMLPPSSAATVALEYRCRPPTINALRSRVAGWLMRATPSSSRVSRCTSCAPTLPEAPTRSAMVRRRAANREGRLGAYGSVDGGGRGEE